MGVQIGATKDVWGSEKVGNLEIRGTLEFREKIKQAIANGVKRLNLKRCLRKLKICEHFNAIEEVRDKHSEAAPNPKDPDSWLDSMNGKGTKAVIRINLDDADKGPVDDRGCKKSSIEAVLGHELGHAVDLNEGKNDYKPYGKIPPGEKTAMRVENAIRRDQDLVPRSDYNIDPSTTSEAPGCRPPPQDITPPPRGPVMSP
ncbi:MAG: M91 family zinc metallopeptidase [Verrucomicrobiia bacterium]